MSLKQKIIDHGYAKSFHEMEELGHYITKVGLPEKGEVGAPSNSKLGKHKAVVASEISDIVRIASYHEFGAPRANIPERPFMRMSFDKYVTTLQDFKRKRVLEVARGKETALDAMKKVGEWFTAKTKMTIRDGGFKELKPRTIARKHSSKPLIDTAQMLNSIQHIEERR